MKHTEKEERFKEVKTALKKADPNKLRKADLYYMKRVLEVAKK